MQSAWRTVRLQTDPHGVELRVGICNEVESFLLDVCVVCGTLYWVQGCAPVENTRHVVWCKETLMTDLGDGRVMKILKEMTDTDNKTCTIRETHQNIINRVTTSHINEDELMFWKISEEMNELTMNQCNENVCDFFWFVEWCVLCLFVFWMIVAFRDTWFCVFYILLFSLVEEAWAFLYSDKSTCSNWEWKFDTYLKTCCILEVGEK